MCEEDSHSESNMSRYNRYISIMKGNLEIKIFVNQEN